MPNVVGRCACSTKMCLFYSPVPMINYITSQSKIKATNGDMFANKLTLTQAKSL